MNLKRYLSAIKYPFVGWMLYIASLYIMNKHVPYVEGIRIFSYEYSLFFIFFFAFFVFRNCY